MLRAGRIFFLFALICTSAWADAGAPARAESFPSCSPESEYFPDSEGLTEDFCAKWNPEFFEMGAVCCHNPVVFSKHGKRTRRKLRGCVNSRFRSGSYCGEMTSEQRRYTELSTSGKLGDSLEYLRSQLGTFGKQGQCGPNNGFLASGRRIIPNALNRIQIRSSLLARTPPVPGDETERKGRTARSPGPFSRFSGLPHGRR